MGHISFILRGKPKTKAKKKAWNKPAAPAPKVVPPDKTATEPPAVPAAGEE